MPHLHQAIAEQVSSWQERGFLSDEYPAISEILDHQVVTSESGTRESRYLRSPQIEALCTYWWLRLCRKTPHVLDLYRSSFSTNRELLESLNLRTEAITNFLLDNDIEALWQTIRTDDAFVAANKLESLRETLSLDYPSYILALAMGAGKTALMGAIIATEFAMALEYPDGPFVQNALVFAPGTTILGSLRELASMPYDRILPPRFHKHFAATVKLIFTRDGDPDIQVLRGDTFNVIVTNTEKIRITKGSIRKGDLGGLVSPKKEDEARSEVANRRLQAIASLPHLAVFSDEAHHTFGRTMENDLKRVRQTIDYLHKNSPNLIAVINTTGTPYLSRQPLRDVVYWYGLSAGIRDDILKSVGNQIHGYSFDAANTDKFLAAVLTDFFTKYGDVTLPNGAPARIAIYFPQVDDLRELRPIIEAKLIALGLSTALVLENTSHATKAEIDAFERLQHDPTAPHRVILLVNKGTEGWNCPSLFACALARKLKTSNNFVLQAASRCLRQVPGNVHSASIYLSMDNRKTLEKELQETYGESIQDLLSASTKSRIATIKLRKAHLPPLVIKQIVRHVQRAALPTTPLAFTKPDATSGELVHRSFDLSGSVTGGVLSQHGEADTVATAEDTVDVYSATVKLAAVYRFDLWLIKAQLDALYPEGELPQAHLAGLAAQLEAHTSHYEIREEEIEVALALVKPEGFPGRETDDDGTEVFTAEISYPATREHLLISMQQFAEQNSGGFGFHYTPYNFDSMPEAKFFEQMLAQLNLKPEDVEDIYFTGALTSSSKTDFLIEYRDVDGKWRNFVPDFVIRKKPSGKRKWGKCLIVEIKGANHQTTTEQDFERDSLGQPAATKEGRKALALKKWTNLNPDRLKYEILYVDTTVPADELDRAVRAFAELD